MALVILTADDSFGDRAVLRHNRQWAAQLAERGAAVEERIRRRGGRVSHLDATLSAVVRGFERAVARAAREGGSLAVLVGHGSGGVTSHGASVTAMCDLGPANCCRVTVDAPRQAQPGRASIRNVTQQLQAAPGTSPPPQLRGAELALWHISRIIAGSQLREVYLMACSLASGGGHDLLRELRGLWGGNVQVLGLEGYLMSLDLDCDSRIEMRVVGAQGEVLDAGPAIRAGRTTCPPESQPSLTAYEERMLPRQRFLSARAHANPVQWQ